MDQGDFFVQLMDRCEPELLQDVNKVEETRVESLCELMIRTSSANTDPYKDDIGTDFFADDIYTHLATVSNLGSDEEKGTAIRGVSKLETIACGYLPFIE